MATNKSSSRNKSKSNKVNERKNKNDINETIWLLVLIAVAILLFISNFGIGGNVGHIVSSFLFGVFGLFSYVFPIAFIYVAMSILNVKRTGKGFAVAKMVASIFFILFLCMFMSLIVYGSDVVTPAESYLYGYESHNGGGFMGGVLSYFITPAFGLIGSYVVDIIVLAITLVLIFERTPILFMREKKEEFQENAIARHEERREIKRQEYEQKKQERALRREEMRVSGVTPDLTLTNGKKRRKASMEELEPKDELELPEVTNERKTALNSDGSQTIVSEQSFAKPEEVDASSVAREINITGDYSRDDEIAERIVESEVAKASSFARSVVKEEKAHMSESESDSSNVAQEIKQASAVESYENYEFPPKNLFSAGNNKKSGNTESQLKSTASQLEQTLDIFGVKAHVTNISCGPAVTRYELKPELGVKVSKIVNLADDIKLNLAAEDIRIEAPIPGQAAVGIEVPNKERVVVPFRDLLESPEFDSAKSKVSFALGRDIAGKVKIEDIAKMPHLLIAGSTGSGKSVCINSIIMSILYMARPDEVKLLLIDPKTVELSVYNGIPHLIIPVVTNPKKAAGALQWAVNEMTDRYEKFAEAGVRDLKNYNDKLGPDEKKLPQIVIVVDELADLMMTASNEVEEAICRLAQLARACGIHLIIATQRPSVNVITGLIKANMPSRIAFAVTSAVDSRTILDMGGAEKLLGKGDMLFYPQGLPKPIRLQGAFIKDEEVAKVVDFLKKKTSAHYDENVLTKVDNYQTSSGGGSTTVAINGAEESGGDPLAFEAARIIVDKEKASIGSLQRYLKVGFNRAARIMDELEEMGVVGPEMGTKPRTVLMTMEQLEEYLEQNG